jgi:hypothetical protein
MGARPTVVLTALDTSDVLARRAAPGDWQRARALVQRVLDDPVAQRMHGALARAADLRARLGDAAAATDRATSSGTVHACLRREHDVWLLRYEGRSVRLPDAKGLHHLATLLASPGTPVVSLALAGEPDGATAAGTLRAARERGAGLEEAQASNDPERVASVRAEIESSAADRAAAGAVRGAAEERARIDVTRAITASLKQIAEHEPELGHLLQRTIHTGSTCTYRPDPRSPVDWEINR